MFLVSDPVVNILSVAIIAILIISAPPHDMKMLSTPDTVVWIKDGRIYRIAGKEELNINIGSIAGATVA